MQSYKLNKYEYKFKNGGRKLRYLLKLSNYYTSLNGGALIRGDVNSLTNYLKGIISSNAKTNKRYFILLYGPPASGKSSARYIAYSILKKLFNEEVKEIQETFIDTNVDELTEITMTADGKTVKETLINNFKETLEKDHDRLSKLKSQPMTPEELLKNEEKIKAIDKFTDTGSITPELTEFLLNNLSTYTSETNKVYFNNRADDVSSLLLFFSVFMGKNIFIEMASPSLVYADKILDDLNYSLRNLKYIPIVMYPFVNDTTILRTRSIERATQDGRFIIYDNKFGIKQKAIQCLKTLVDLYDKEESKTLNDTEKSILNHLLQNLFIYDSLQFNKKLIPKDPNSLNDQLLDNLFKEYERIKLFEVINENKSSLLNINDLKLSENGKSINLT
jgi:hypothetical protein